MNRTLALCALLLSLGCTSTASVTFHWNFAGASCSTAGVDNVKVQLGATTVTVPCTDPASNIDGVTLNGIPGGDLAYTLTGFVPTAGADVAQYQATGSLTVLAGLDNETPVISLAPLSNATTASVAFQWIFNGTSCVAANVDSVKIDIAGTSTTVGCIDAASGVAGITLSGIPLGTQAFTLTGYTPTYDSNLNYSGDVATFQLNASVGVQGGVINATGVLNLPYITPPVGNANSNIIFLWSFEGKSCASSSPAVNSVVLTIDGPPSNAQQCNVAGLEAFSFAAGSYPFTLAATAAGGAQYSASGTATVDGVQSVTINVDMQQSVSSTPGASDVLISYVFGTTGQTCQQAGIDTLHFALTDATGTVVTGSSLTQACTSANSVSFSGLSGPNVYYLYVQGIAQGKTTYQVSGFQFTVVPSPTASSYQVVVPKL